MKKEQASACCPNGHNLTPSIFNQSIRVLLILFLAGTMLVSASASAGCDPGQVADKFGTCCNPENLDDCNVCFGTVNCDDGNACTIDACEGEDLCSHSPISINADVTGTAPNGCGQCNGTAAVDVTGGTPPYTYLWSTGDTTQSIGSGEPGTDICINAGDTQYIASAGDTFITDYYYNPGTPNTATYSNFVVADIAGTTDDLLYRTERSIVAVGGTMTYNIPVVNGSYDVELHFAELFFGVAGGQPSPAGGPIGKRKFDVFIEGVQVLDDYDIVADVGPATAVIKSYLTTVTDDTLDIAFTSVLNRAKVNGLCVKPHGEFISSNGLCAGIHTVTVTDNNGCATSGELNLPEVNCDDLDACTIDDCDNGNCINTPIICDDNNPCTDDICAGGSCQFTSTGFSATASGTNPTDCGSCDGSASVTASGGHPPYHYLWSTGDTTESLDANETVLFEKCYNSGSTEYIASTGDTFHTDFYYSAGTVTFTNNTVADILGTTDDILYRSERNTGNSTVGSSFNYNIPVANGQYDVELHFAELFYGVAGGNTTPPFTDKRKFDVSIEGNLVLDDYDINADVGPGTAVVKTFSTTVNDGFVTVVLTNVLNRAKINGICVKAQPVATGGGLCAGTYSVTLTDSKGCTAESSVALIPGACDDNDPCTEDLCENNNCTHNEIPGCNDPCNNVLCNDDDACTTDHCESGECVYEPVVCNDNELCTQDACLDGNCFYFSDNCDDADACTNDICLGSGFCDHEAILCDDGNPCTDDACNNGTCVFSPIICNDENDCTNDACDNGQCVYIPVICNDNNACTSDACDEGCVYTLIICDDLNACTTNACDNGQCVYTAINCNDNNSCTTDFCLGGFCLNIPIPDCGVDPCENADCNDNDACTTDACDNGTCLHTDITCNDNDACTTDACSNGQCVFTAITCDDNDACTTNACLNGQCVYTTITCNDNDDCTTDLCNAGICSNTPIVCNDNDACTTDNCVSGRCNFKPISCDDQNACTTDACNGGSCSNTPLNCNDNDACTQDACNNGICGHINICNPCSLEVLSFTLINSLSDLDIGLLENGSVINLYYTPNVNVRANLCVEPIGSVKFNLNGPTFKIENTAPYALAGDNPTGNYNKWNVSVGTYTLTAIPYPGASATGTQGTLKTITFTVINQQIGCFNNVDCNDNDACTNDECHSGQCSNAALNCNDNNLCTTDACNGGCVNTPVTCDDNNLCTADNCNSLAGCEFTATPGCCLSAADCDDNDICTIDACESNTCSYEAAPNEPSYLHVVNTAKSWKKLKLGYSPTSLYTPKYNVIAGGNNMLCVTLRGNAATEWGRVQIRPQGSVSSPVSLGSYGLGTTFTEICIPLTAFGAGVDFTQLTLIEIPYSNGAAAFEIDIQKIEFRGGATPFLWFGDAKTDNKHDGGSFGSLIATLVQGSPCGASKMAGIDQVPAVDENTFLNAYPNPFNEQLNVEFSLPEDARVKLEIFNLAGQRIAQLFEGNVTAKELNKFEFTSANLPDGMLIYRLQTEKETFHGKAVLVK